MPNGTEYVTMIFTVNLKKEDISTVINLTSKVNGLVTIVQGSLVASAKSLLGLLNVDYNQPMEMLIQGYITDEQLNELKKYKVEKEKSSG